MDFFSRVPFWVVALGARLSLPWAARCLWDPMQAGSAIPALAHFYNICRCIAADLVRMQMSTNRRSGMEPKVLHL